MNIIYIITTLILYVLVLILKKSEQKLNICAQTIVTFVLYTCYDLLTCYILTFINIPINMISLTIANILLIVITTIKIIKDKQIQKFFIDKKDIIFLIVLLIIATAIVHKQYGNIDNIKYYSTDAREHYNASKLFYKTNSLMIKQDSYEGFMPYVYTNEGLIYKALEPIIGEFNLYKVFIISDTCIWILAPIIFYLLMKKKANTWIKFGIISIASIIYALGYPLNSMLTGFHYLQAGINLILLVWLVIQENNVKSSYKMLSVTLINIGAILSYNLFAPFVYVAEFVYYIYENYKENGKLINKKLLKSTFITLILPGMLGLIYFVFPTLLAGNNPVKGIENEGYIYRNMWSTFILFIPFSIYYIMQKVKHKEIDFDIVIILSSIIYSIIIFCLYKANMMSSYYYCKMNYILWAVLIYMSTMGLLCFYDKRKINKVIAIVLVILYLGIMVLSIKDIRYIFKGDYIDKEKENITTIMGIFNINRTLLEMPSLISKQEIQCLEYVEDNIDSSKTLFLVIPRQEDWKQVMLYKHEPHSTDFSNIDKEIGKWNNGEYEYIVLFKNRYTYKTNKQLVMTENTQLIYENKETQIWMKGEQNIE